MPLHRNDEMELKQRLSYATEITNFYQMQIVAKKILSRGQNGRVGRLVGCGLMSQSTIFQSCRDGATASWVINQYFRGVKCLAQGHNTAAVGFEPLTSRSGVRHSTTEPPRSPEGRSGLRKHFFFWPYHLFALNIKISWYGGPAKKAINWPCSKITGCGPTD